jgi:hypothetical protein
VTLTHSRRPSESWPLVRCLHGTWAESEFHRVSWDLDSSWVTVAIGMLSPPYLSLLSLRTRIGRPYVPNCLAFSSPPAPANVSTIGPSSMSTAGQIDHPPPPSAKEARLPLPSLLQGRPSSCTSARKVKLTTILASAQSAIGSVHFP